MPYLCKNCGETEKFRRTAYGSVTFTETQYIDQYGDINDMDSKEYNDEDIDDYNNYECGNCGSDNVEDVSDEEWTNALETVDLKPLTWKERFNGG